jgi:hypothetical protein
MILIKFEKQKTKKPSKPLILQGVLEVLKRSYLTTKYEFWNTKHEFWNTKRDF